MSEDIDIDAIEKRMNGAVLAMKSEFQALRTGRASASLLDKIMVNAYGAMTPLNQCAGINVPEPRMITVTVWDKTLIDSVDKAIRESNLGINPVGDGMMLRLPIPELNEERRIELTKVAGGYAESARIAVRNVRRDGMDQVKKSDELSEDDQKIWSDEIQELTNVSIKKIDEVLEQKQAEIMQV
ncbi:ribosome recycling factor [Amylibacter sp.]|jgi:ribosome recycling factor|nr:ribosome recycling factor [Amylibacter sp.]MDA9894680.1 ribosome recycling factor [Amylibacter sp.]MDB0000169.1 ribosome recycling factor [Amylibacter sp.]MDB2361074.1 ribosome recycling factor [Amylibacter sp.]MDB2708503.1 ribosome recycling factor [Amylibacter sp.]|tara:strand:- start:276 stop:827 length:552 start_codon:yes stop_codon:yes gene_type:complete